MEILDSISAVHSVYLIVLLTILSMIWYPQVAEDGLTGDLGSDLYIQLNFTSVVSLTYMKAKGLFGAYVSQFRLEVQDESGNFNVYGITSEPTVRT